MLFLVLLFVIAALITLQYARWIRINSYSKRIPSVEPIVPILGHIPMLCGINTQEIFEFFVKSFQQVDRMGKIMLGPVPMVMVNHPDLMEQILTNGDMYNKPFLYDFFELGVGLITEREQDEFHSKLLIFLDQVLTIRKGEENTGFTDREILDHLLTIMGAGQDTSAYAVAYTLLLLAMNPDIQSKVVEEIDSVFSSNSVEVTVDTLQQLKYTEQVIKESLRLLPVAPILGRETSKEIELDGVRIPPNQMIMYNLYALHRRPDVWGPDPERFDPDRFGPEAVTNRHPYAYLPFSGGLRNCIGWRYALNSMRIILLRILQNYELKTDLRQSEMRFKFEITMKLIGPHRVWLTERPKRS
ncbi:hypothetical protein quinque_004282 [Culex quinquefasciatus]